MMLSALFLSLTIQDTIKVPIDIRKAWTSVNKVQVRKEIPAGSIYSTRLIQIFTISTFQDNERYQGIKIITGAAEEIILSTTEAQALIKGLDDFITQIQVRPLEDGEVIYFSTENNLNIKAQIKNNQIEILLNDLAVSLIQIRDFRKILERSIDFPESKK